MFGSGGELRGTGSGLLHQFACSMAPTTACAPEACLFHRDVISVRRVVALAIQRSHWIARWWQRLGEFINFGDNIGNFAERGAEIVKAPAPWRCSSPYFQRLRALLSECPRSIRKVDCVDFSASLRTSSATTAKPEKPHARPARAASMAALRARRLVCSARSSMTSMILPMSSARWPRTSMICKTNRPELCD